MATERAKFASFLYTSKSTGETARHTLILGASYHSLVERSKLQLELTPVAELIELGVDAQWAEKAKEEVLKSFNKTLAAHAVGEQSEDYRKRGQYVAVGGGLNINSVDNTFQLFGLSHAKVVITPGEYKSVNSRPLTIAKDKVKSILPISKFREFSIDAGNIHSAKIDGEVLIIE